MPYATVEEQPGSAFEVRQKGYLEHRQKAPSERAIGRYVSSVMRRCAEGPWRVPLCVCARALLRVLHGAVAPRVRFCCFLLLVSSLNPRNGAVASQTINQCPGRFVDRPHRSLHGALHAVAAVAALPH